MGKRFASLGALALLALLGCDGLQQGSKSALPAASSAAPAASSAPPPAASSAAPPAGPVACSEVIAASPEVRRACRKDWTVLIYMAADNDLSPFAYADIEEAEANAASTASLDVLVQLDLKTPPGIRRLHLVRAPAPDRPLPPPAERTPGDIRSPVVSLQDDESTPPDESLEQFLSWGVEAYPSRHTMVVVWGHGLGWRQKGEKEGRRYVNGSLKGGIAFDDSPEAVLDTPSLRAALAGASQRGLGGRPFDVYASDACLMQSLEVAGELADVARYIVGSEQVEPYVGLPYGRVFAELNGSAPIPPADACDKEDTACAAAVSLPALAREGFEQADASRPVEERGSYTISTLDSRALTVGLYPELRRLAAALGDYFREKPERTEAFRTQLGLPSIQAEPDKHAMPDFLAGGRDLGILLRRIDLVVQADAAPAQPTAKGEAVREAVKRTQAALARTILAAKLGNRYDAPAYAGHAGVSVWTPRADVELGRMKSFASSRFYGALAAAPGSDASGWRDWIEMVYKPPRRGHR